MGSDEKWTSYMTMKIENIFKIYFTNGITPIGNGFD
jgi:hypothetical protein